MSVPKLGIINSGTILKNKEWIRRFVVSNVIGPDERDQFERLCMGLIQHASEGFMESWQAATEDGVNIANGKEPLNLLAAKILTYGLPSIDQ